MNVYINGEPRKVSDVTTVSELLRDLGVDCATPGVAVAVNAGVVTRQRWPDTRLADGDKIEVIRATQGG
jgi:sulfur carrier protein